MYALLSKSTMILLVVLTEVKRVLLPYLTFPLAFNTVVHLILFDVIQKRFDVTGPACTTVVPVIPFQPNTFLSVVSHPALPLSVVDYHRARCWGLKLSSYRPTLKTSTISLLAMHCNSTAMPTTHRRRPTSLLRRHRCSP